MDAFYVWTYELPTSPWFYVGAGALVVLVLMMCLFPLAPYQVNPPPPGPTHHRPHPCAGPTRKGLLGSLMSVGVFPSRVLQGAFLHAQNYKLI